MFAFDPATDHCRPCTKMKINVNVNINVVNLQALILILARPLVLIHVPVYGAIKPFVSPADDVRILTRLGSRKSYECGMGEFFFTYELNING